MCVDRLTEFGEPRPETGFTAPRTLKWANEVDFNTRDILMNEIERGLNSHQHGSECRPCREANWALAEARRIKQK
jgi:hypothetical protein